MKKFLTAAILLIATPAFAQYPKYEDALAKADKSDKPLIVIVSASWCGPCKDKPLIVIVSASWCGPCKVLKSEISNMAKTDLKDTVITIVDIDERPDLAKLLMDESTVPQLVMYGKSGKTESPWKRVRTVGVVTKDRILEMVRKVRR